MGKNLNKKEVWVRSDLRLIFSLPDGQEVEEMIENFNRIVHND